MRKFKLKSNKIIINVIFSLFLIITLLLTFASSFYMQKLSNEKVNSSTVIKTNKNKIRSEKIDQYVDSLEDEKYVEDIDIKKEITSVLTIDNDKYASKIFDYETGEELTIDSLIKENKREEFWNKIKELLYLKYPNFIADILSLNNQENVYFMKDNELIIYYYNYEIEPAVNEDLFLKVNYNEIKDYLDITVDLDSNYQNENGFDINSGKKLAAITFDDGPGPYTERLVEILNNNKVHSTFFMLGKNINSYKDAVLSVYNSGNEIGYHSYAHTNFKRQELETIKSEFDLSNEYLESITGTNFTLTRPPYGSINEEIKNTLDTPFILWNIDTEDWRHKDVDYLVQYVLDNIKEGSIILFHDIHKTSIDATEKLLPYLYVAGYQLVTVSTLSQHYGVTLESHEVYRYFK